MRTVRTSIVATLVFGFMAWAISLGGMAGVSSQCYNRDSSATTELEGISCARGLQMEWFSIWFEFFLLIAVAVSMRRGKLTTAHASLNPFLAIVTAVLMFSARSVMTRGSFPDQVCSQRPPLDAAAAGMVMMCVCDFLLIMLVPYAGDAGPGVPIITSAAAQMSHMPAGSSPKGPYAKFSDDPAASAGQISVQMTTSSGGAGGPFTIGNPVHMAGHDNINYFK